MSIVNGCDRPSTISYHTRSHLWSIKNKMSSKKFSHRFSGLSIWIEPDPEQSSRLIEEMEFLRCKCGGIDAGLHRFVPHCTLLYNFSLDNNYSDDDNAETTREQQGESMLRSCLEEFHRLASTINKTSSSSSPPSNMVLQLIPTSQYYFPYPKTADNGKGFGCCISLLILETTPHLQLLHEIVRDRFPPDERHGEDNNNSDETNLEEEEGKESRFRPHMALVYAPEDHENVTSGWLESRYTIQSEAEKRYMKWINVVKEGQEVDDDCNNNQSGVSSSSGWDAKYISLWSTEGTLDEWYPIVKLELGKVL